MDNSNVDKLGQLVNIAELKAEAPAQKRPRAMTTLKLQWLAERLRKAETIRKAIAGGTYEVDSNLVARAVLGLDPLKGDSQS